MRSAAADGGDPGADLQFEHRAQAGRDEDRRATDDIGHERGGAERIGENLALFFRARGGKQRSLARSDQHDEGIETADHRRQRRGDRHADHGIGIKCRVGLHSSLRSSEAGRRGLGHAAGLRKAIFAWAIDAGLLAIAAAHFVHVILRNVYLSSTLNIWCSHPDLNREGNAE